MSTIRESPPGRVREQLIAALIPDAVDRRELAPPAPLPMLPALHRAEQAGSTALLVVTARMDHSGRVHERILLRSLGWEPGQRLEMDTLHSLIVVAATPTGPHVIDARGAFGLPAGLRHLCGIQHDTPLVLAAVAHAQVLVVHPAAIVAEQLAAHYTRLLRTPGGS